jgi:hypothetical protein
MAKNVFLNFRTQVFEFNVTDGIHSGAAGAHVLGELPAGAVITHAWIHVKTTCTSENDNATIKLGYTGADDAFEGATAISSGTTWDDAVPRASDAAATNVVANFVPIASAVQVLATVATETVTAGRVRLYVQYYVED